MGGNNAINFKTWQLRKDTYFKVEYKMAVELGSKLSLFLDGTLIC